GLGLFVLLCLYLVDRMKGQEKRPRGLLISVFFVVYFTGRFLVEFYKEHQTAEPTGVLTMGQYLSIPGFIIGVAGVIFTLKNPVPAGWPQEASAKSKEEADEGANDDDDDGEDEDEDEDEDESDNDDAPQGKLYDPDVDEVLAAGASREEEPEPKSDTPEPDKEESK